VTANRPDASIWISTDWGADTQLGDFQRIARPYAGPVTITDTTQVRAVAVLGDEATDIESHTFISYPTVLGPWYDTPEARAALESLPVIEVSGTLPTAKDIEVAAHVEMFWPSRSQQDVSTIAGVRKQGSISYQGQAGYHRLWFRDEYGSPTLDYPLFADENLHGGGTDSFGYPASGFGCAGLGGVLMQDRFYQGLQRATTGDGVEGDYFLLFDQGRFAGVRNVEAVPYQPYMAAAFGGDAADYGLIKDDAVAEPATQITTIATAEETFARRDLPNFIDHHLIQWLSGATAWPTTKFAVGGRVDGPAYNWVWHNQSSRPACQTNLGQTLGFWPSTDPDFQLAVADRVQLHFFDDGALTPDNLTERWNVQAAALAPVFDLPITTYVGQAYARTTWDWTQQALGAELAPKSDLLLDWLRTSGYVPELSAPAAQLLPGSQRLVSLTHGVDTLAVDPLAAATDNTVRTYYTLDGSDPRLPGGAVSPSALAYTGPIAIGDGTVEVFARRFVAGVWSAARPELFAALLPNGGVTIDLVTDGVRVVNNGEHPVDLEYFRLQGDVRYKFDYRRSPVLAPGEQVVVTKDGYVGDLTGDRALMLVGPQFEHIDTLGG